MVFASDSIAFSVRRKKYLHLSLGISEQICQPSASVRNSNSFRKPVSLSCLLGIISQFLGDALAEIRRQAEEIETIYYGYVLDGKERLIGVVSLRELLLNAPEMPITEVMTEQLKTVEVSTEPEEILLLLAKYDLIAVPVIKDGKMAGVVTIDDVVELFLPYALKRKRHHM